MSSLTGLVLQLRLTKCVFAVQKQCGSCRRCCLQAHSIPHLNFSQIFRTICAMGLPEKWKANDEGHSNTETKFLKVKSSSSCLEHLRKCNRFNGNTTDGFTSKNSLFPWHRILIKELNSNRRSYDCFKDQTVTCVRHYRGQTKQRSFEGNEVQENPLLHQKKGGEVCEEEGTKNSNVPSVTNFKPRHFARNVQNEFTRPQILRRERESERDVIERRSVDEMSLAELSRSSLNIVPYVKRSPTLQGLVRLGVSLDKIQQVEGIPELLIKYNFQKDIVPFLKFLRQIGVPPEAVGNIFTKNPLLFKENIASLELRVGYLLSKNFSLDDVASMVIRSPIVLLMDPYKVDEKLGFLQNAFQLSGSEVRHVALTLPKILTWRRELIADVRFHVKEFIGFTNPELKEVILKEPKVFLYSKYQLVKSFDYLHNTMMITHQQILSWPGILLTRVFIFKNRHLFLLSRGQAQYDPCLENFVPLKALGSGPDEEFCQKIAKCDVNEYYDFCKTL
ncbi:unnamed protein product [Lymnaea stagnalis]|uniref:Transcription termination factor 3, mitochondrial n=1 Tax=Lymnaea stagnalis TaxID=6523 RepID=A0AAV2I359_LYMST